MADYTKYIRERITELRMKMGISEYQMSIELGQNKNYIQGITSGKSLPSMTQFLNICEYFGITPMQFFDSEALHPKLIRQAIDGMQGMSEQDLVLLLAFIDRLSKPQQID